MRLDFLSPQMAISPPFRPWPQPFRGRSLPPWLVPPATISNALHKALRSAVRPRIHVFLATSDIHLQHKLRISRQQCLDQAAESVRLARTFCEDVEFSPEDATRTEPEFLFQVLEAVIQAGATTLNIPDTVGYSVPAEFGELIRNIREKVRGVDRCHYFDALPQ